MARIKDIIIKQQNGEQLSDIEQAVVDNRDPRTIIEVDWEPNEGDLALTFKSEEWLDEDEEVLVLGASHDDILDEDWNKYLEERFNSFEGYRNFEKEDENLTPLEWWNELDNSIKCQIGAQMFEREYNRTINVEPWYCVKFTLLIDGENKLKFVYGPKDADFISLLQEKMEGKGKYAIVKSVKLW